jgi:hypothetical protein
MDKPRFIRALLEEVGTAINPIALVRRIPEGLEIEGLREGLKHIMKEHEIQYSICEGAARVLRSEVAAAQGLLRMGQRKGVKFEVARGKPGPKKDGQAPAPAPTAAAAGDGPHPEKGQGHVNGEVASHPAADTRKARKWTPGHCADCLEPFVEWEVETLVGFACGHVFHLTHLLARLHPGEEVDELVLNGVVEQRTSATHLIGAKVTHARLLRDRIAGGCPVCVSREEDG